MEARRRRIEKEKQSVARLRTARRTLTYIIRTMILALLILTLCILAFLTTERMSNLYILVSEGMSLRADCVLGEGDRDALHGYFTGAAIARDEKLNSSAYNKYEISTYNYDLEIEKIAVYPWSVEATVTAVETVTLKGTIGVDYIEEGKTAADYPLPEWERDRLAIHFVNSGLHWYITSVEILERKPYTEPLLTPDPDATVLPMATPTPSPDLVFLG